VIKPSPGDAPPNDWNEQKEAMYQDWLAAGKPGLVATNAPESLWRDAFNGMLEAIKRKP